VKDFPEFEAFQDCKGKEIKFSTDLSAQLVAFAALGSKNTEVKVVDIANLKSN